MKSSRIVLGVVEEIEVSGLIICIKQTKTKVFCPWIHLSDYQSTRQRLSVVGTELNLSYLNRCDEHNREIVSHKYLHPKKQHRKNKIIPTATHFQNLHSIFKNPTPSSEFFNTSPSVEPELIDFKKLNNPK